MLLDYAILVIVFGLWGLLDSWGIAWREPYWNPPGKYNLELSKEYTRCLLVIFGILSAALITITSRWELIPAIVLAQQAGTEDFIYWFVGTTIFKKDWSFTETKKFLGIAYPKKWPWLDSMPILKYFSSGAVTFGGLVKSVFISELFVFVYLVVFNWLFK